MDARYTRTDFHDGISRYGASLTEAVAHRAAAERGEGVDVEVAMLISDERQLALLPKGVPWHRVSGPTSPRSSRAPTGAAASTGSRELRVPSACSRVRRR